MKEIKLKNGVVVLVDNEEYDWLIKFNWSLSNGYVVSGKNSSTFRQMHVAIWWRHHECFTSNTVLDHINRNKLDNQLSNLREVSSHKSNLNRSNVSNTNNITQLSNGTWQVRFREKQKIVFIKTFSTIELAIAARINYEQQR